MFALHRIPTLALIALAAYCALGVAAEQQRHIAPSAPAPAGERRVALVIGNSAYKSAPLRNPVNDARAMSKALAATGFAVTLIEDATQATMWRAIRIFGDQLQGAGSVGLFYYAGHGVQVRGKNYLVPVNADLQREDEVEFQAIDANSVLAKMDSAKNVLNLMILDACRNNPFARGFRSTGQGLAQMDAPSGTLVAFATAPGAIASDGGDGPNGVYTKHLLANLPRPGLPVELMFKQVRIAVSRETLERQIPWEASSLRGNFSFVPGDIKLSAEERRLEIENAVAAERAEQQRRMERVIQEMLAKQGVPASAPAGATAPSTAPVPAALSVAAVPAAPAAAARADGMPPVGTSWRYGFRDLRYIMRERFFTIRVTGIDGSTIRDSFSSPGVVSSQSSIDALELRFATRPLTGGYTVIELAPYLPNWRKPGPGAAAGYPRLVSLPWEIDAPQIFDDEVAVSAGKFKAVRVQVSGTLSTFGSGSGPDLATPARFRYTAWYAPEIKRYAKIRHQTWTRHGAPISDEVVQLVEYRPAPAAAPAVATAPDEPPK